MAFADIVALLTPSNERTAALRDLQRWIAIAEELARDAGSDAAARDGLRKHVEGLSTDSAFTLVSNAALPSPDTTFDELEQVRALLTAGETAAWPDIARRLRELRLRVERSRRRARWRGGAMVAAKVAAWAVPVAGAFLVGTYFRLRGGGLYPDSFVFRRPLAAYEASAGGFSLVDGYRQSYLREFSRFYFGRKSAFVQRFWTDDADKTPPVAFRLSFRNPRNGEPLLISSVEARAELTAEPFPWNELDVTPSVALDVRDAGVLLRDDGIGPAMNLETTIRAGELLLGREKRELLYNEKEWLSLLAPAAAVAALSVTEPRSDVLQQPVYWERQDAGAGDFEMLQCFDGRIFERVSRVSRLRQLGSVVQGGSAALTVRYESLRGEAKVVNRQIPLPDSIVYVARVPALSEADDPCAPPLPEPPPPAPVPPLPTMSSGVDTLLDALVPAKPSLKGVDLIKVALPVDFDGVTESGTAGSLATPDEILNPAGYLIVDVALRNPRNGTVAITLRVNGKDAQKIELPLFVPEQTRFRPWELAEEIAKLKGELHARER